MRHAPTFSLALLILLVAPVALATTVIQMDLDALVSTSDAIVIGEVSEVDARLHEDGRVYTHVDVKVDETLKGEPAKTVTIVHVGGKTKERATMVHGMPGFTEEERVLLFLEKPDSVDHFVVTGLAQGKFSLTENEKGTVELIPDSADMALVKPIKLPTGDVELKRAEPGDVVKTPRTLDDIRSRIDALLQDDEKETR